MAEVTCARCGQTREGLDKPPYPDELGREIAEKVCVVCWDEARNRQVMIINEYRLDLSDDRAQEILEKTTREFLGLETGDGDADAGDGDADDGGGAGGLQIET